MGVEYYLACNGCKEFLDLHKWPIVEEAASVVRHSHYPNDPASDVVVNSQYRVQNLGTLSRKVCVTANDLAEAINTDYPQHEYILKLVPLVRQFAHDHCGHQIFLSCDLLDPGEDPWHPDQPTFHEWKQIPGVFNYDHYLPRNLIEVFDLDSWPETFRPPLDIIFRDAYLTDKQFDAVKNAFTEPHNKPVHGKCASPQIYKSKPNGTIT